MSTVAVSQRVDVWSDRGERRDALDQSLCRWLAAAGCAPVPVPNALSASLSEGLQVWLQAVKPDAIVLSGGNDIGEATERDDTERFLLEYAKDRALPLLGLCRGMQMMAVWAGGELVSVEGHVRTRHRLKCADDSGSQAFEVNSFHGFALAGCPLGFEVIACAEDGVIEFIRHESLPWQGWMWHPERESNFNNIDLMRFRALLELGSQN